MGVKESTGEKDDRVPPTLPDSLEDTDTGDTPSQQCRVVCDSTYCSRSSSSWNDADGGGGGSGVEAVDPFLEG